MGMVDFDLKIKHKRILFSSLNSKADGRVGYVVPSCLPCPGAVLCRSMLTEGTGNCQHHNAARIKSYYAFCF